MKQTNRRKMSICHLKIIPKKIIIKNPNKEVLVKKWKKV